MTLSVGDALRYYINEHKSQSFLRTSVWAREIHLLLYDEVRAVVVNWGRTAYLLIRSLSCAGLLMQSDPTQNVFLRFSSCTK